VTNKNQPLPSLAPERDQVEAFHTTRGEPRTRKQRPSSGRGGGSTFSNIMVFVLLSVMGVGAWWFDMQNKTFEAKISSAEARIQELEDMLSATGEEMGESTVVIKARLTDLTERTEELWTQMDKLWASAWRRNQADIKELGTQITQQSKSISGLSAQDKTTSDTIKSLANKQTETDFNLGILTEQMADAKSISAELNKLKSQVSALETSGMGKEQQQIQIAGNIAELERQLNSALQRLAELEKSTPAVP